MNHGPGRWTTTTATTGGAIGASVSTVPRGYRRTSDGPRHEPVAFGAQCPVVRDVGRYRPGVVSSSVTTRTPLPEGTVPIGVALLISGVATYAFFKIGTWAVGGADAFNPISSLWFATFALAPGFFLPLEQEIGRALSHRRAMGEGGRPVVHRIARLSGVLIVTVVLIILAFSPIIAT